MIQPITDKEQTFILFYCDLQKSEQCKLCQRLGYPNLEKCRAGQTATDYTILKANKPFIEEVQ